MIHGDIKNNIQQYENKLQNINDKITTKTNGLQFLHTNRLILTEFHQKKKENSLSSNIKNTIQILHDNKFIVDNNYSKKLLIANNIHETNPLVLSTLYEVSNGFDNLSSKEICGLFSCFTNLKLKDEYTLYNPTLYTYDSPN